MTQAPKTELRMDSGAARPIEAINAFEAPGSDES